jgi:hypothetical protein
MSGEDQEKRDGKISQIIEDMKETYRSQQRKKRYSQSYYSNSQSPRETKEKGHLHKIMDQDAQTTRKFINLISNKPD